MRTLFLAAAVLALTGCAAAVPVHRAAQADNRTDFAQRMLDLHNGERVRAGLPALTWSIVLSEHARAWAEELAPSGRLEHSINASRPNEGENLFRGTQGAYTLEQMGGYWLAERANFKPGTFPQVARSGDWTSVGHYSQIVWPATTAVGCGIAIARGTEYLVCRYSPPGNVRGQRVG